MNDRTVAYFSMEIAVVPAVPTYSGGLGILAGDTLRAAADSAVPMLAVSLLHRKGYHRQSFDSSGWQHEQPADWDVASFLTELPARATVKIEDREVSIRVWKYEIVGVSGYVIPVFFLDTDLPENSSWDRTLTHFLYGGDAHYRLCQEVILGIGGVRMLRVLGCDHFRRFHMNEGHASLLTLELLDEDARNAGRSTIDNDDIDAVRARCIFTTHTPFPSGHDQYPMDMVGRVLGNQQGFLNTRDVFCEHLVSRVLQREKDGYIQDEVFSNAYVLNLTYLALNLSHFVNGVAKRHAEVSRLMFAEYKIDEITNGVHAASWIAPSISTLLDSHIPGWEIDNFSLRYAHNLPPDELWEAHLTAKQALIDLVFSLSEVKLDPAVFTIGFARRATAYKRADLLFTDLQRLKEIANTVGPLQIVYGGKAHPHDTRGKEIIQHIFQLQKSLPPEIKLVFLENYDQAIARILIPGVDVWLNTPLPPLEASGTSGMKAALNGVPSLSILDGWWIEGCIEGVTGWAIGELAESTDTDRTQHDATALYDKLEQVVLPLYHENRPSYIDMMRHAISLNGSFFNTQRMIQQYVLKAYFE